MKISWRSLSRDPYGVGRWNGVAGQCHNWRIDSKTLAVRCNKKKTHNAVQKFIKRSGPFVFIWPLFFCLPKQYSHNFVVNQTPSPFKYVLKGGCVSALPHLFQMHRPSVLFYILPYFFFVNLNSKKKISSLYSLMVSNARIL